MSLDSRFEVRTLPSGAQVVVRKDEIWNTPDVSKNKKESKDDVSIQQIVDSVKNLAVTVEKPAAKVEEKIYVPSKLSLDERFELVHSVGEEVIQVCI